MEENNKLKLLYSTKYRKKILECVKGIRLEYQNVNKKIIDDLFNEVITEMFDFKRMIKDNKIRIDDYTFELLAKYKDVRDMYKIQSTNINTNEIQIIYFYRSLSEGGVLRLCHPVFGAFDKGYNYTQSTMVDIRLQCYVNNLEPYFNWENFNDNVCEYNKDIAKLIGDYSKTYGIYKTYNREVINPYLFALETCMSGSCFANFNIGKELTRNIEDILSEKCTYNPDVKNVCFVSKDESIDKSIQTEYLKALREFKGYIEDMPDNVEDQISSIYKSISKFLSAHFEKETVVKYKNFIPYTIQYNNAKLVWRNYFNVIIKDKKDGKRYKIDVIRFSTTLEDWRFYGRDYDMLMNIYPIESRITKYGISNKYCPAGVYIYKPLEYQRQCAIESTKRTVYAGHACYLFIEDLMQVFPKNENGLV